MNRIDTSTILGWIALIFIALVIIWIVLFLVMTADVEAKCLKLGWADYAVAFNLKQYCIREENEYEITVPLSDVISDSLNKGADFMDGGG